MSKANGLCLFDKFQPKSDFSFSQDMNPIEYTLNIQRLSFLLSGLSFLGLCCCLVFLDPYTNSLYIGILLALLAIFSSCVLNLVLFWFILAFRKEILAINQVNNILYSSLMASSLLILLLAASETNQLNIWVIASTLMSYGLYQLWLNFDD